jgi:protein gp37
VASTRIEWADSVWNPTTGCTRVSDGCDNCYAVVMTKRLAAMGQAKYAGLVNIGKGHFNGVVRCHEDELLKALSWKKPRRVFVNSMSDLFHKEVPFEFIEACFGVMAAAQQHTFQILTKRPERAAEFFSCLDQQAKGWESVGSYPPHAEMCGHRAWKVGGLEIESPMRREWPLPNVWLGTSVESQEQADERIPHLLRCPAAVRFLSCEPLIEEVNAGLDVCWGCGSCLITGDCICDEPARIHWVIVGGESGPNARPMHPDWAR